MSKLICNLPAQKVWVRKEYLMDHQSGFGKFVEGVWVSAKSIPGRAFYFETFLPKYGALFDKLPISAFLSREKVPEEDMDLPNLQFWNCMDYNVTALHKQFIGSMDFEVLTRDFGIQKGRYICTLDNYHQDIDAIDYDYSWLGIDDLIFISVDVESKKMIEKIIKTSKAQVNICAPYDKTWLRNLISSFS